MNGIPSLLRLEEHRAMSNIELSGSVLDLGGDKRSNYKDFFKGEFSVTTLNLDEKTHPDITHDLEFPLPVENASFDGVLLINVLEHVFEYRQLIEGAAGAMRPGGTMVIVVPFLFPVHPSPRDFHRFTSDALTQELERVGLKVLSIEALGGGVFSAGYVLLDRLLPKPLRLCNFYTFRYVVYALDNLASQAAKITGKKYRSEDYALGFCVKASI
ncbi:hypothetical protein A2419_01005 [Candidatus Adlerbacteria bacterium RIFOXYC1_FULL_48_26]|uniref:Uncharacterized protein n=1 Tax=Candidatus Adlerbacteria bacterium RIFOXYC1_FULL_48_26 TaxID=1797247 RepID=A0A1F4Y4V1_9BACT|nr:MAG: hypothetical protein A2419_01005 [Candidatus Adlerbacteria bacterium RIFOXYC1_FULL_48_26]OGC94211.1 MAG: hypothetical protein A2389_03135 [Candidatus Adlerbacteria bacterium RIFOXYB1_FULL_48_10]